MHVGQDVAQDEHPVLLAPERDMTKRMARCFEHPEPTDLVTLAQVGATQGAGDRPSADQRLH